MSEQEYADFELEFEFKLGPRGNSGLALRSPLSGDPAFDGIELQMADIRYNPNAKDSELTGGLYRAVAPRKQVYRPTEWNRYEITLEGNHLRIELNDELIHDLDLSREVKAVKRHDGSDAPPIKDRPRRGHIGFQDLSRGEERVLIRNTRIKTLPAVGTPSSPASAPRVFLLDAARMQTSREMLAEGDETLAPALRRLRREADDAMDKGPYSVVNKQVTPPSGDQHDYMSLAPYWWPNPDTRNGLPYIRRDGERNPEINRVRNRRDLGEMAENVETLASAFYFTGEEQYASRARELIRVWFLDADTRMNPNFKYAQAIRGVNDGRGIGLIESRLITKVVDAIGLLDGAKSWTSRDQREFEQWLTSFLDWMLTSEHGKDEADEKNNHGTYYDIQVASFSFFLNRRELAVNIIEGVKSKRIAVQIEPDGRQLLELKRTRAWSYSIANLNGLMSLAKLGEHVYVDLWNYETEDGRSLRAALDFLIPFATCEKRWPYQELGGFSRRSIYPVLRLAALKYPDGPYKALLADLHDDDSRSIRSLVQP
jgi:hypothetical protein